jgi:hypothetical protein
MREATTSYFFWVIDMSKIKREIAVFIVFVILVVLGGLLIKLPFTTIPPLPEPKVGDLKIQFKDGVSESEVKAILKNYDMTHNLSIEYNIKYNISDLDEKYYILVNKDKIYEIKNELKKEENWTSYAPAIKKGNYYIVPVTEQAANDKFFFVLLNKYNLQLKKFVWCEIDYRNKLRSWIPEEDAKIIKRKLETDENIFTVRIGYLY